MGVLSEVSGVVEPISTRSFVVCSESITEREGIHSTIFTTFMGGATSKESDGESVLLYRLDCQHLVTDIPSLKKYLDCVGSLFMVGDEGGENRGRHS